MSGLSLNPLQTKLHQAALSARDHVITAKQCETLITDPSARQDTQNFLLRVGLLKLLKDAKGVSFKALTNSELKSINTLSAEDNIVLNHIQVTQREGIWVKHLKVKTNLHQVVLDRSLKLLVQKGLIKRIQSVQHKTRKIYMVAHLDPSVEMTGGPWYTDGELDTEFIKLLSGACLHFIRDRTFPKKSQSSNNGKLFPISRAPAYPSAHDVLDFLKKSRVTETQLNADHVGMLLHVLVLDGDIEKILAFGASMWTSQVHEDAEDSEVDKKRENSKRQRTDATMHRDDKIIESDSGDSDSNHKRSKGRKKQAWSESGDDMVDGKARKKRKLLVTESEDERDGDRHGRHRIKRRGKVEGGSKGSKSKSKSKAASSSPSSLSSDSATDTDTPLDSLVSHGNQVHNVCDYVYRAVRQERVTLNWSQTPCHTCPSFTFCHDKGPVNSVDCYYYEQW